MYQPGQTVSGAVKTMQDQLAAMQAALADKADHAQVAAAQAAAQADAVTAVNNNLAPLQTTVATVSGQYTTLSQLAADYQAAVAASQTDRAALHAQVDALAARKIVVHRAQLQTPVLALGAKSDVAVTWQAPFTDAAYTVEVVVAPALVGKLTAAVKAGTQTSTGITVTLTAGLAVAAGLVVDLTAVRFA